MRRAKTEARTVVHVLGTAVPGGAGHSRLVSSLARGLDPDRYRVVAVFLGEDGPLAEEVREAGAVVVRSPWSGGPRDPTGAVRFVRAIRVVNPAILHHHVGGLALSELTRLASGAVVLAHVHGRRDERGLYDPSLAVVRGADGIVATSRAVMGAIRATARVIPPGVVIPAEQPALPLTDGPLVLGTAGRLAPIKGVVHLVRALPAVLRSAPDVVLEILGEGLSDGELRDEATRLGIGDRVRFLGWHSDVGPWLERFDVYVQPSLYEGLSIATLEAMARARPVIATAVGGTPELVTPGSGVLVPAGDSEALGDAIVALLEDPDRRRTLARAAWERAHAFSEAEMVRATTALYDELLDPRPAARPGLPGVAARAGLLIRGVCPDGRAHCIKRGYLRRVVPRYSRDTGTAVTGWQPTVYAEAAALARKLGATRIVDIGCAAGAQLMELAPEFATIGLDFGTDIARARSAFPDASWVEHDLDSSEHLPLAAADLRGSLVLAAGVIERVRRPRRLLSALRLALADCNAVILTTPDRDLTWGIRHRGPPPNPAHVREWNSRELEDFLCSQGLTNSHLRLIRSDDRRPHDHTILAVLLPAAVTPSARGGTSTAGAS
jgi:glycosyltransferase involved in cell wall biosynthesis/SAM-dependent methyltransferase